MAHRRPPQLVPFLYVGPQRIFFTMCTFDRRTHFIEKSITDAVRDELLRTATAYHIEVVAYCFMPDHVHFLAQGQTEDANLLKFAKMFRQRAGHSYRKFHGARLWQEGYFDRSLRAEEATLDVAGYIVANPVRAGLCSGVRDYPYWGSSRYTVDEMIASLA